MPLAFVTISAVSLGRALAVAFGLASLGNKMIRKLIA